MPDSADSARRDIARVVALAPEMLTLLRESAGLNTTEVDARTPHSNEVLTPRRITEHRLRVVVTLVYVALVIGAAVFGAIGNLPAMWYCMGVATFTVIASHSAD